MTTPPTLPACLLGIAELAPDLITLTPRAPLWEVTESTVEHLRNPPLHGPLLFWDRSFEWEAGLHRCLAAGNDETGDLEVHPFDVSRILPGLIQCCLKRGWTSWQVGGANLERWTEPFTASTGGDGFTYAASTPTHALAWAIWETLKAEVTA